MAGSMFATPTSNKLKDEGFQAKELL